MMRRFIVFARALRDAVVEEMLDAAAEDAAKLSTEAIARAAVTIAPRIAASAQSRAALDSCITLGHAIRDEVNRIIAARGPQPRHVCCDADCELCREQRAHRCGEVNP